MPPLTHTMARQDCLLIEALDGDEAHIRLAHRTEDSLRVIAIILCALALAKRLHELGRHELGAMPMAGKDACPVVRGAAGLNPDRARWKIGCPGPKAGETELFEEERATGGVAGAHDNHLFCEIHPDSSNLVHEFPFF